MLWTRLRGRSLLNWAVCNNKAHGVVVVEREMCEYRVLSLAFLEVSSSLDSTLLGALLDLLPVKSAIAKNLREYLITQVQIPHSEVIAILCCERQALNVSGSRLLLNLRSLYQLELMAGKGKHTFCIVVRFSKLKCQPSSSELPDLYEADNVVTLSMPPEHEYRPIMSESPSVEDDVCVSSVSSEPFCTYGPASACSRVIAQSVCVGMPHIIHIVGDVSN